MSQESALQTFIAELTARVEPMMREANLAYWELQTTSSPEAKQRATELQTRLARVYTNREEYAFLQNMEAADLQDESLAR